MTLIGQRELQSHIPEVAVIIPAFNRLNESINCLVSCERLMYPRVTVYFVDDGSTDGTQCQIPQRFPQVHYIRGTGDLWWTGSINLGITQALADRCEFVLLLNQDVLLGSDYLDHLVGAYQQVGIGIYGGVVYYQDDPNRIWAAGGYVHRIKGTMYHSHSQMAQEAMERSPEIQQVDWLPGMGTLLHRDILERVGLLESERLPHYFSDAEYCLRARRNGIPTRLVRKAALWHDVGEYDSKIRARKQTIAEFIRRFFSIKSFMDIRTNWVFYGNVSGILYFTPHMVFLVAVALRDFCRINLRRASV
jgi:GT2 family glycosyltransferase